MEPYAQSMHELADTCRHLAGCFTIMALLLLLLLMLWPCHKDKDER